MAKKKRAHQANPAAGEDGKEDESRIERLFTAMQEKGAAWYCRERQGLIQLESFQSALVALREAQESVQSATMEKEVVLAGLAGNVDMDPWLAEDLYQHLQTLAGGFEDVLNDMYALQAQARISVINMRDDQEHHVASTTLRPIDYLQMMNQELATFEAEYQYIEALLRLVSFEMPTDELRTLVISWSTSPYLDPAQSRSFLQRHRISCSHNGNTPR